MSDKNLIFFNKEGDYLNFEYTQNGIFEGDIIFHENSNDTFKTYGLYMGEKIPEFEFESPGELATRRFQLFNEHGFNFYGSKYTGQNIKKIEPVNNDPDFNSKWIYGDNFDAKFPIGSLIKFDSKIFSFGELNISYPVVSSKVGAIMIIDTIDNSTFDTDYPYEDTQQYTGAKISGVNAIGIYDFSDFGRNSNLSEWNEQRFYEMLYTGKKLNIVGSEFNDAVLTYNQSIIHNTFYDYVLDIDDFPENSNLIVEVILKTDVPKIFTGRIEIINQRINIIGEYPQVLKPGVEFQIVGSDINTNFITVADIPYWSGIVNETYFEKGDQVIFDNIVYECSISYTQSFSDTSTSFIDPKNSNFWSLPTHIKTQETLIAETNRVDIYLTTNVFTFQADWESSYISTMSFFVEKFKNDFSIFNIDLSFDRRQLSAKLIYPSQGAIVNFYFDEYLDTNKIGNIVEKYELLMTVRENIITERNLNFSKNFRYNIVFTDIDRFGLKITINGMVYEIEAAIIFSGATIDSERTIDRTIRNWINAHFITLFRLGIDVSGRYSGPFNSSFFNSIEIKTQYPNVPIDISQVLVGTTADFYLEHSNIHFFEIGPFLNININDSDYIVSSVLENEELDIVDIPETLKRWVSQYRSDLSTRGIEILQVTNKLSFRTKNLNRDLSIKIFDGLLDMPGIEKNRVFQLKRGNIGCLIASNELVFRSGNLLNNCSPINESFESFLDEGFATGMVISINNSPWVFNNTEYNITYLDDSIMNLSYQGPFWGMIDNGTPNSPFLTLEFNCDFRRVFDEVPEWDGFTFSNDYTETFNPNTYSVSSIEIPITSPVDIQYVQLNTRIYVYGDNLAFLDAETFKFIDFIELPGNSNSIEINFNKVNNLIYLLSSGTLWIIDPISDRIISEITLSQQAFDLEMNPINGDVYVSYSDSPNIDIWSFDNISTTASYTISPSTDSKFPPGISGGGKMVFNDFEQSMYIATDGDFVLRVGNNRLIRNTYEIPDLKHEFIYYEPVRESVYVYGSTLWKIDNGVPIQINGIQAAAFSSIIFNNLTGNIEISDSTSNSPFLYKILNISTDISSPKLLDVYGYLAINQFDGSVWLSAQNDNSISSIINGIEIYRLNLDSPVEKLIYNPERGSIMAIQPSGFVVEILVGIKLESVSEISSDTIGENLYGTLAENYTKRPSIWVKTREHVRRPRENFIGQTRIQYYWRWLTDETPDIFMYDFSGTQLETTTDYAYTGPKPLNEIVLNRKPNRDLSKINKPEYQQTIFDFIFYPISYINDSQDITSEVELIQLFLGFKSENEGVSESTLQLFKREDIIFTIASDDNTIITLGMDSIDGVSFGTIKLNINSNETFSNRGLKEGQRIVIYLNDSTNDRNQYTSDNNASVFIIRQVFTKTIILDFIEKTDFILEESTVVNNYPNFGQKTYLNFTIKVADKELARFSVKGQTEEEDERFKIELGNLGKLINPDEVFIFKHYDIQEGGIDWTILNKKRKEMLMMKHLIYNYIGSYKSIISAINYFGYNDLELNEYYRNIDPDSENFFKLFKVEIPDIFNNSVEGWSDNDIIKDTQPNNKFEETNLFNLTYNITNKNGDNILEYSLDEVIIKLQGLKYWLKKNIIPLTHKIMDITGRAYLNSTSSIVHKLHDIRIFNIKQEMTPVTFKLNESYLMPVNSGSTVYNCVLDFYSIIPGMGTEIESDIKPFNGSFLSPPESFNIKIRTWKTYKEWAPFTTYSTGDRIIYFERIYESAIDGNRLKNPRKFESVKDWSANIEYLTASIVRWRGDYYTSKGASTGKKPNVSPEFWLKITEWKEIDKHPVQTIKEYRRGDDLLPFNFTIDSNIDPFITIEVISENGYGQIFNDVKNYEIRGIKDLVDTTGKLDPFEPFEPIPPVFLLPEVIDEVDNGDDEDDDDGGTDLDPI
jgi:hypothetical protein